MDALSDAEWVAVSKMIMERTPPFREAVGIPRGGVKLGDLLNEHATGNEEDSDNGFTSALPTRARIVGEGCATAVHLGAAGSSVRLLYGRTQ